MKAQERRRGKTILSLTSALNDWMVNATPRQLCLGEREPGTHRTGGWVSARASVDGSEKSPHPPGFDPPTVQPVTGGYTDHAIKNHRKPQTRYQVPGPEPKPVLNAKRACKRTDRVTLIVGNNEMNADRNSTVVFA